MRLPRKRWAVVAAAAVVLAGGGTTYAVATGEDTPTYRTVTAAEGDVEQTLTLTGTVDAAQRADLSFGTDGTVAKVLVAQGGTVTTGQVIARLDTDDLDAALTAAESTLGSAKAQLESDQDAQTSSVEQAVSGPSAGSGGSGGTPSGSNGSNGSNGSTGQSGTVTVALLKKLKAQQQAVLDAQSAATKALDAAKAALAVQKDACAAAYGSATPAATPADGDAVPASDDGDALNAACDAALANVQDAQAVVEDAQDALADALNELGSTLTGALGTVTQATPTAAPTAARTSARTVAATADTPSADSPSSNGSSHGSSGGTVTAARLASDQAQIDQAEADLITARAARRQAVLRATRSGTVAQLGVAKGDSVTTGTAVAVILGGNAVTLAGTVSEDDIEKVKVGQTARVTVPGSSKETTGTVTAIGLMADSSSGSTAYPVTVTVEDPTIALPTGSTAQVALVVATAKDVVTLPVSAISRNGDAAIVRVWNGSTLSRTAVTLGAVGARTVAITDGVEVGTEVVVADVDQAISGASSELDNRSGFPGGGAPTQFRSRSGTGPGGAPITITR